jgi:hypothetical protein
MVKAVVESRVAPWEKSSLAHRGAWIQPEPSTDEQTANPKDDQTKSE